VKQSPGALPAGSLVADIAPGRPPSSATGVIDQDPGAGALRTRLSRLRPSLEPAALEAMAEALRSYEAELLRFATQVNLVSHADLSQLFNRHILPAVAIGTEIRLHPCARILDVGSGAGLPGIPLAITIPESQFVLVEARRRRANFLRHCVRQLRLPNATVVNGRAEELQGDPFEIALSRAVGGLKQLQVAVRHVMQPHGLFLATQQSHGSEESLDHVSKLHPSVSPVAVASIHRASCG